MATEEGLLLSNIEFPSDLKSLREEDLPLAVQRDKGIHY
jgi:hypothetical protein